MISAGAIKPRCLAVWSKDLDGWDFKSALAASFRSAHSDFVPLGHFIEECVESVHPWLVAEKHWPVYGVNNRGGVFFSHRQQGSEFNASYKSIRKDWFFHNPTRANVGSMGRVPEVEEDAITSPEYQVWRIKDENWLPEYVEILIQMPFFSKLVQVHRVGAVKERLYTQNLMQIPVPCQSKEFQLEIINRWHQTQAEIAAARQQAEQREKGITQYIYTALGVPKPIDNGSPPKCLALQWEDLERWSFSYLIRSRQGLLGFQKADYPIVPLSECLVDTMNGYCIKPVIGPTPHKMLKLNALAPSGLDLTKTKYIHVPDNIARRFSLRKRDLLICRSVGSYEQVAKCALVEEDCPDTLFPDIIIRARLTTAVLPQYVREVMQTPVGRAHFLSNARTAVGMWKIGAEDIRTFPLPLPPLDVQQEIVQHVTRFRAEIAHIRESTERLAQESKAEIEAMILGTKRP